ncbi:MULTISPECIES: maltodextrin ABC transporter permease MdxF [Bacillus]|uniref:maltodextrin ABC transporter permease MdxF n=1 Tax=Bacillus TaxID=1386 RepID=UPI00049B1227|nr:maltodextrin ABC transporter permease MdxF [Bacillus subtilis]MBL3639420.1 maltodextrin ABC transporter permease MdxF [Alkalicoccobacillus gibsonii]AIC99757.1 sugar ABC transporter permease [Bacillus subtilis subsp. subtilis str. OH 131.1]AOA56224.1 Maltodextrin transport system permease protein MdxF [Bacillus subtilis]MBU8843394.1 maltodextrin ABC transporter permease MdxF [Alkalicoccobacillus gibsonii]MCM3158938.1 maltodextrin ABC transporter permease MdxF [Bacillus subtilis]
MNKHHTLAKQKRKAGLLSIIPGLGQIANQQLSKGLLFLAITGLFAFELCVFGIQALTGLMTLGSVPGEDHSLFMLIEGTLQLIVTVIFLMFYIFNIHDSRKTAAMKAAGLEVNTTAKDMICHAGDKGFPYLFTLPAYIMMVFVIIFPVLVTLFVALTNYDFYHIPPNRLIDWVGFKNFLNIFFLGSYRETFVNVLGWTVIWTICATTLQIILGIVTALFVNQDFIKGKRIFRMIFLFPWAVPAFITIMSFSNMFNDSIGAVNAQVIPLFNHLPFVELPAIAWKTDPFWTKTALIMIQTWLGFPYIYVMVTGVLQAIPGELYEAAKIDGATFIQRFRHITFPMILFATAPVMITQYTFNFNNFSIIYLFNEGGPGSVGAGAGSTDILISWIYKLTTGTSPQYSVAAAVTLLISFIVIGISLIAFKKSNAFGNEEVM